MYLSSALDVLRVGRDKTGSVLVGRHDEIDCWVVIFCEVTVKIFDVIMYVEQFWDCNRIVE